MNGKKFCRYVHRIEDLSLINSIAVRGGVNLKSIQISEGGVSLCFTALITFFLYEAECVHTLNVFFVALVWNLVSVAHNYGNLLC